MPRKRFRRARLAWLLLGALAVVVGSSVAIAQEQQLGGKVRAGARVLIPSDESVPGNLYVTGGEVRVEGTVEDDLVVSGGQVHVSGEVGGDLLAGSGNVDISGDVGGDVRAGAGRVVVSGSIEGDLAVGAGQTTITSSGRVGEDFLFGAGQVTLDGEVAGDVLGSTGDYVRRGTVGGSENVTVAEDREPTFGDHLLRALGRFLAVLVVGALFLWLAPRVIAGAAWTLRRRPLGSLGVGLLGMIGYVLLVIVVVLAVVLLGILFGLLRLGDLMGLAIFGGGTALTVLTFLFFLSVFYIAHAVVGMALGGLIFGQETGARWLALVVGVLVVVVLSSLPVVGGWIGFLVTVLGLGALILEFWPRRRRTVPEVAAEPTAV